MEYSDAFNLSSRHLLLRLRRGNIIVEEGEIMKLCSRCNEFYPFDEEFWYAYKSTCLGRYVSMAHCRSCERERANQKRQLKNPPAPSKPKQILAGGFVYHTICE